MKRKKMLGRIEALEQSSRLLWEEVNILSGKQPVEEDRVDLPLLTFVKSGNSEVRWRQVGEIGWNELDKVKDYGTLNNELEIKGTGGVRIMNCSPRESSEAVVKVFNYAGEVIERLAPGEFAPVKLGWENSKVKIKAGSVA